MTPKFALLAVPESTPATIHSLYEVFLAAGRTWEELTGEETSCPQILPRIVARTMETISTPVGLPITPQEALGPADVVIVADLALAAGFTPEGRWDREAAWLREHYDAGATVCSVCTGSLLLAESGLLDGEIATTHWSAVPLMKRLYPRVGLAPERILAPAGDNGRIVTSGGMSSWEDLALHLIARHCGPREAIHIAKIFLFGDRAEGQMPFAGARKASRHEDAVIADAQVWIADHYTAANPVSRMVARSGLPERTFKRRFMTATGYAPMDYVQTLRIEEAKQLLETSAISTGAIAAEVGYGDPTYFRRLFKRRTGITPARYRQRFSTIGVLGNAAPR